MIRIIMCPIIIFDPFCSKLGQPYFICQTTTGNSLKTDGIMWIVSVFLYEGG